MPAKKMSKNQVLYLWIIHDPLLAELFDPPIYVYGSHSYTSLSLCLSIPLYSMATKLSIRTAFVQQYFSHLPNTTISIVAIEQEKYLTLHIHECKRLLFPMNRNSIGSVFGIWFHYSAIQHSKLNKTTHWILFLTLLFFFAYNSIWTQHCDIITIHSCRVRTYDLV